MIADIELIDFLKLQLGYDTDVKIADYLNVTKHTVYRVRAQVVDLGAAQRFKILEKSGYLAQASHITSISAKQLAQVIAERIDDHAAIIALANIKDEESSEADRQLLALIKKFTNDKSDEALAKKMGLKRTSLSMVRKGKVKFGIPPRLRILKLLDPEFDIDTFEKLLSDSNELLQLLKKL